MIKQISKLCMIFAAATMLAAAQEPPVPPRQMTPAQRAKWRAQREGKLKPGDDAPDFALKVRGGSQVVRLSSFTNRKPVALVFGSYT
jgi:hypothetical protein